MWKTKRASELDRIRNGGRGSYRVFVKFPRNDLMVHCIRKHVQAHQRKRGVHGTCLELEMISTTDEKINGNELI